jgi:hypothetical protein
MRLFDSIGIIVDYVEIEYTFSSQLLFLSAFSISIGAPRENGVLTSVIEPSINRIPLCI